MAQKPGVDAVPESTIEAQIMWRSDHGIRDQQWYCRRGAT